MESINLYRIVVASPGDVQAERDALPAVLEELNRSIAATQGLRLELGRWETDAYPGFHPQGPQGLFDPLLRIEDCDMLLGIFWKRFGTPTKEDVWRPRGGNLQGNPGFSHRASHQRSYSPAPPANPIKRYSVFSTPFSFM